jgi:hypothetical protein
MVVLIRTFHRPPDSLNYTFDLIEHSIDLAVDTGVNTIVVLHVGDFNQGPPSHYDGPHDNRFSHKLLHLSLAYPHGLF